MKTKMKTKLLVLAMVMMVAWVVYAVWQRTLQDRVFECRAQLHTKIAGYSCDRNSVFDVFISMHGNGEGYLLISGTYACPNASPKLADGIVDFRYKKEAGYYAIHMGERDSELINIFKVLKYDNIKLKISRVNTWDYILSLPNQTLMICTED